MNSNYEYFSIEINSDEKFAFINRFEGIGKGWKLTEGIQIRQEYPNDAIFDLSERSGVMTTDFINNTKCSLLISERVKKLFETLGLDDEAIEYLPFQIRNKRGRIEEETYYIANILTISECLDTKLAEYDIHPRKGTIWHITKVEIDKEKVVDRKLFRLKEEPTIMIMRSDLAKEISENNFTGLRLCPVGKILP